jgi:hypothetical protein
MKRIVFIVLFYFFCNFTFSQKVGTIPFEELIGGVMMVKAKLNNIPDTLNFILDTGNSHISLDSATAAELQIPLQKTTTLINGIGGTRRTKITDPIALHLTNVPVDSFTFFVNDYSSLTESYGERIDGIIGYAFISKYILGVNFDSSLINVFKRGNYTYPKRGFTWSFAINYLPSVQLNTNDASNITANYYLDCGAGLSLLMSDKFVKDSNLLNSKKKLLNTQVDGVGGKSDTRLTTIKELRFGKYRFKNVPTYLYPDNNDLLNYPTNVGLIGNDILRRFNWVLNYAKKEIHLIPNKNYRDEFDYSYTGLSIYQIDGLIVITEVLANSPAAEAGLKIDDIIITIDNTLVTNIKTAKDLLQKTNRKVRLLVIRDKHPVSTKMYIKSIL